MTAPLPRERGDLHDKKCELVTLTIPQSICRCRERQLAAELEEANRRIARMQKALGEDCLLHAEARIADLQYAKRRLARYREKYGELE